MSGGPSDAWCGRAPRAMGAALKAVTRPPRAYALALWTSGESTTASGIGYCNAELSGGRCRLAVLALVVHSRS